MTQTNKHGIPLMQAKKKGRGGYLSTISLCPVCDLVDRTNRHHLKPLDAGYHNMDNSQNILRLCWICHRYLHAEFSNDYLAEHLHTLALIQQHPLVKLFVAKRKKEGVRATTH